MKNRLTAAALTAFFCLTWAVAGPVLAKSSFFAAECSSCHNDDSTTCNGCHHHGTVGLSATTDAAQYAVGDTITVTFNGGTQQGWLRSILYDQDGFEIDRSTGPGNDGDDGDLTALAALSFPVTLSAEAPSLAGTYTWSVAWYGSPDGAGNHEQSDPVSTNEFQVIDESGTIVPPSPKVTVNGSESRVTVRAGEVVTAKVSLDPGSQAGQNADWWVAADTPFGLYWFTLDGDSLLEHWVASGLSSPIRVYGGPLFALAPFTVFDAPLPSGEYVFYFGVDDSMDGTLVLNQVHVHSVHVTVE